MNFAMYLTGNREEPVKFAAHKKQPTAKLKRAAKEAAGTNKGALGRVTLDSGILSLEVEDDKIPKSIGKKFKKMLKEMGFAKYRPRIVMPGGIELGDHDEDDDDDEDLKVTAPGGSATETSSGEKKDDRGEAEDPQAAKEKEAAAEEMAEIGPKLEEMAGGSDEKAADQAEKLIKLLASAVDKEDWKKVRGILKVARKLVESGGVETAEKNEVAAEDEADGAEEEAGKGEDKARGEMAEVAKDLAEVRGEIDELEPGLEAALEEAIKLDEEDLSGKKPNDWDARLKALRKVANGFRSDLIGLGKKLEAVEAIAGSVEDDVKKVEAQMKRVEAMRERSDALGKAIEKAAEVEADVDEEIEGAGEETEGALDAEKMAKLKALTKKKLSQGLF